MAMTKVKNLQLWCKKMAEGYRDVEVRDMAASWKSGLAFCAIIHRFRPDLIDYDSLSKENVFENNDLAFEVAEKQLNIPAFLEAADMVAIRVPDKLSVVTYVSQYYNYFHNKPQLGGPGVNKFNPSNKKVDNVVKQESKSLTPVTTNSTPQAKKDRQDSIGDRCLMCHERVYLLERHIENGKLYHRSCFRKSEMSPASKVFKRQPKENTNDIQSNKVRKLDNGNTKESNQAQDSGLDFWQRRAQKKAEQASKLEKMDSYDTSYKKSDYNSTPVAVKTVGRPESQFNTDKKPVSKLDITSKFGKNVSDDKDKKVETKVNSGLANKFKALNDRNLKVLNANDPSSKSSNGKETSVSSNDRLPKFGLEVTESSGAKSGSSPVPKPRQNVISKHEQMDTEPSSTSVLKPVSHFQKSGDNHSPKASPRNFNQKPKSPVETRKNDFSNPKTSSEPQKSKFNLNLKKTGTEPVSKQSIESPSLPPPLPTSSPPKIPSASPRLPKSEPPKHNSSHVPKVSTDKSPFSSPVMPRSTKVEDSKTNKSHLKTHVGPPKPPRNSVVTETNTKPVPNDTNSKAVQNNRSESPMDTFEAHSASKAVIKGPDQGHSAVLVVPKRSEDEKKNREVFGGLLKSLAGVRQKHDAAIEDKADIDVTKDINKSSSKNMNGVNNGEKANIAHRFDKKSDVTSKKDVNNKSALPQRPKSSFVSQSSNIFSTNEKKETNNKGGVTKVTKTTTTKTDITTNNKGKTKDVEKKVEKTEIKADDGIPEWKRQLEQRKKARPKTADLLTEKSELNKNIPVWQIEAEKRKEARKGVYVDPEKAKLDTNTNSNNQKPDQSDKATTSNKSDHVNKSKSPERLPVGVVKPIDNVNENKKKKLTVMDKFNFDDVEINAVNKKKPPRPAVSPLQSPSSPKLIPPRPPPPKTGTPQSPGHHLTAYQIQKQLKMIDERLTKLELKGRALEDSIRKAKEEEEDDLMINWFELVNEKNDLVRKECDFIYISREQELEIEQIQIDQQLRELVDKPNKTKEDEKEEEMLMEKLVDVVNQRSNIVDSIDEDRIRYLEEDSHIQAILQEKGFSKDTKDGQMKKEKQK
ncbi:MICAL-like [Mactra antiquata]